MEHFYKSVHGWFNFTNLYREMVKTFDPNSIFVEIGTWKGQSACFMAVEIINSLKQIDFYCVDTWDGQDTYGQYNSDEDVKNNTVYSQFLKNIEPVNGVIKPIRKKSSEAVDSFKDNSIDFIFIDASHDYDNVKKDMVAWFPKLKKTGIFAGHDYQSKCPGVIKAVQEFSEEQNLPFKVEGMCWRFDVIQDLCNK